MSVRFVDWLDVLSDKAMETGQTQRQVVHVGDVAWSLVVKPSADRLSVSTFAVPVDHGRADGWLLEEG